MNELGSSPKEAGQTPFAMQRTLALVLTGVSGSGKSEVGREVANRFGLKFLDADDFHSSANKDKMHRGVALSDDDRRDWLKNLHEALRQELDAGTSCVLACSALKRAYREQIRDELEGVRFFYLKIDYEVVAKRLESRTGHFEKKLLNSQFAILEEPEPNEAVIIDQNRPLAEVVQEVLNHAATPLVCNQPKALTPMASDPIRLVVVVIAILALIVLITKFRIHPFIALILASWFLGVACGLPLTEVIKHFEKGFGDVLSFVGIVIGLGAMLGGILISSGGADVLANDLIALGGKKWIPWTMFLASLLIGLPLFFEVGFVLLVPLAFVISKRMDTPILRVGLPMLAGLSIAHALVPPHPAPTLAVVTFHADAGKTILYAILVGIPTGILAGPLFANFAAGWVHSGTSAGALFPGPESTEEETNRAEARSTAGPGPSLPAVLTTILLPPALMMSRSLADAFLPGQSFLKSLIDFVGDPIAALLIALFFGMYALEFRRGRSMGHLDGILNKSLGAIAAVVLIVGAGGGFKEMLLATKISELIGQWATQAHISPLLLGWGAAAVVRIATGSATVATITGAGIMAPIVQANPAVNKELMVLAVGSGSIILSHVNDAGFWLVKEYFQLSLPDTFKSWTLMETLLSVLGLTFVLLLSLVV